MRFFFDIHISQSICFSETEDLAMIGGAGSSDKRANSRNMSHFIDRGVNSRP